MKSFVLVGILACCVSPVVYGQTEDGPETEAGDDVQEFVTNMVGEIKIRAGIALANSGVDDTNFYDIIERSRFIAATYRTQMGDFGTNFFVKILVDKYIFHVKLNVDQNGKLSFKDVKGPKRLDEPLEFF